MRIPFVALPAFAVVVAIVLLATAAPWQANGAAPIVVTTTVDEDDMDNADCSLREAIKAANMNDADYNGCTNAGGSPDAIEFDLSSATPMITISSALPIITGPVTIDGNTGASDRIELRGPTGTFDSAFNGLKVGIAANGTIISNLVIDSFPGWGIWVDAPDVTILGNLIGTDATGMSDLGNGGGIVIEGAGVQIGDSTGATPGGSCSGHCNLVSGSGSYGINIDTPADDATVQSNFIGTNLTGTAAIKNNYEGIFTNGASGLVIGGSTIGEGNVVSGNGFDGIYVNGASAVVQGNLVGTNSAGTAAIPNASPNRGGITVVSGSDAVINHNLVSGNAGDGLYIALSPGAQFTRNLVGVAANGTTALPNEGRGAYLANTVDVVLGGVSGSEGNTIAFNDLGGVVVENVNAPTTGNTIRGNSIHDNTGLGIDNVNGGNNELTPPTITGVGPVTGVACANCTVDVYSDAAGEGATYHGSTTANGSGDWTFNVAVAGPNITATATDTTGNTSEFSAPFPAAGITPTQGDADCDGDADLDDVVVLLADIADTSGGGTCGGPAQVAADGANTRDVDCDGSLTPIDALDVLLHVAGLPELPVPSNCPAVGDPAG